MAGEALRVIMDMGKFQGVTAYTTPTGSLITTNFLSFDGGCSGNGTPCQAAPICIWQHHTLLHPQAPDAADACYVAAGTLELAVACAQTSSETSSGCVHCHSIHIYSTKL